MTTTIVPLSSTDQPARATGAPARRRGSDPISRPARLWSAKSTSREGQFIRQLRAELTVHVGGNPSVTQRMQIERAVMLATHLAVMDAKALDAGGMSDHARREYLAWDSSLRRMLRALGVKAAAEPATTPWPSFAQDDA